MQFMVSVVPIFPVKIVSSVTFHFNTLRTGGADLRFYIKTVQDG
jgi:hypothetical protein